MYQEPRSRGWNSLSRTQQIIIGFIGVLVLYALLSEGGSLGPLSDPLWIIASAIIVLVAFPVHEMAHAAMAVHLGDDTPRVQGRYTFNPLAHIDPLGALLILFTGFGWAKPVMWNPNKINADIRLATVLVAAAGPVSNLLLAALAVSIYQFVEMPILIQVLHFIIRINVLLFTFNMLPVPPLDGSAILFALLPGDNFELRMLLTRYGILILLVIVFMAKGIILAPADLIFQWLFRAFG